MTTRLKAHRLARGINQTALARMTGVNQPCVSFWESGQTKPRPRAAADLEAIFGLPIAQLLAPETDDAASTGVPAASSQTATNGPQKPSRKADDA